MSNGDTLSVKSSSFIFKGEDDAEIHAMSWLPSDGEPRAVLIINHGMAEHISRYHDFSSWLAGRGFAVYGEDHRGHGETGAHSLEGLGFFAPHNGWMSVISDIRCLYKRVLMEHPGLPVFMLGHSMGSFLTRHYISLYNEELAGAILLGTGSHGRLMLMGASLIAALELRLWGASHKSRLLNRLSFGAFNRDFASLEATGFEWLSRDNAHVKAYVDDPYCGFICTVAFYRDLFDGLKQVNSTLCFKALPEDFPLLILSGSKDPVGGHSLKGLKLLVERYRASGLKDLTFILKEGLRHECLNELGREEVFEDIFSWLGSCI